MKTFPLRISSPDGDIFCHDAAFISLRGTEGELAIMAGHIPFITAIKPCNCKIITDEGKEIIGRTDGGLLTVSKEKVLFLTGTIEWSE